MATAQQIVDIARNWLGCKQGDATHRAIIDLYNTQNPRPRGYKVSYNDAWCATFVTAVFIKAGALDLIHPECGCESMINGMKTKGIWIEDENRTPNVGDIVFYDWQDPSSTGAGDDRGSSDHVGIVESVSGNSFVVIEGNYSTLHTCARRTVKINQRYIRGFATPKYDAIKTETKTETKTEVKVDAITKPTKNVKSGSTGNDVKWVQTKLNENGASLKVDGIFGAATLNAVLAFQKKQGLVVDGIVGVKTIAELENPSTIKKSETSIVQPIKQVTKQGRVNTKSGLNIRAAASISSRKLGAIPYGNTVTITDMSNKNWYKINWRGIVGYCSANYIKLL